MALRNDLTITDAAERLNWEGRAQELEPWTCRSITEAAFYGQPPPNGTGADIWAHAVKLVARMKGEPSRHA